MARAVLIDSGTTRTGMNGCYYFKAVQLDVEGQKVKLVPGDHVLIKAGQKHRITHTDQNQPTIWLAIHLNEPTKT